MTHTAATFTHPAPDPPKIYGHWWKPEHSDLLAKLIGENRISFRDIVETINATFDTNYTRSSVLGRARRLGLCKTQVRRSPEEQKARKRERDANYKAAHRGKPVQPRLYVVPSAPIAPPEISPLNLALADLPNDGCRFIAGDDHLYCGHPRRDKSSYCEFHHGTVWVKPLSRGRATR